MNDLLEARNNWIKNNVGDEQYHEFVKDLILQFLNLIFALICFVSDRHCRYHKEHC